MLSFTLNNKPFWLDEDASVELTWKNPACNLTDFPGDVGLNINIPVNENNRALLGNPGRFEKYATGGDREFEGFEIRFQGILLMAGTLVVEDASDESYSCYLSSYIGNIGAKYREGYIADCEYFHQDITWENKTAYDPDTDIYCHPEVRNPYFFKETGGKITLTKKVYNEDEEKYVDEEYETTILQHRFEKTVDSMINKKAADGKVLCANSITVVWDNRDYNNLEVYCVTPMLYVNYIIKQLLRSAGLSLNTNFLATDSQYKYLCIYNNYDISSMLYFVVDERGYDYYEWVDLDTIKGYGKIISKIYRSYDSLSFRPFRLLPEIKLKDFFLGVQNHTNSCFHFRTDKKVDIIDRDGILTGSAIDIGQFLTGTWVIGERKDVTLKFTYQHDNNDVIFSEQFEQLDDRRDDILAPVEEWEDLKLLESQEFEDIHYVKGSGVFAEYRFIEKTETDARTGEETTTEILGWEQISMTYQNGYFNYGKDDEEEIPVAFGVVAEKMMVNAYAQQNGSMGIKGYNFSNFGARFIYQTSFYVNFEWERLAPGAIYAGLLDTRWRSWANLWAHRLPVERKAIFPLNMLRNVVDNIWSKFRCDEGEFIIEELTCKVHLGSIGISTIKGYKL